MNPLRLTATGLGRFPDIALDLPTGTVAIAGPNGAGKSTLLNAIELALFADGSRDLAPCLGPFSDRLEIELTFEHGGETYRVRRGYRATGSGGKATLDFERHVYSGADGPSDAPGGWNTETRETAAATQAHICSTLGLSRATFGASAFLGQGNAGAFPDASPAERKAMLGEILDPHRLWPRLAEHAAGERKTAEGEIAHVAVQIDEREQRAASLPALEQQLQASEAAQRVAQAAAAAADAVLEQAQADVAANQATAARVQTLTLARDHAKGNHADAAALLAQAEHAAGQLPDAQTHLSALRAAAAKVPLLEQNLDTQRKRLAEATAAWERKKNANEHAARLAAEARRIHEQGVQLGTEHQDLADRHAHLLQAGDGTERCGECKQLLGAESRAEAIATLAARVADLEAKLSEQATAFADAERAYQEASAARVADLEAPELAAVADIETPLKRARLAANGVPAAEQNVRVLAEQAEARETRASAVHDTAATLAAAETALAAATEGVADEASLIRAVQVAKVAVTTSRATLDACSADVVRTRHTIEQLQQQHAELVTLRASIAAANQRVDLLKLAEKAYGRDGIPTLIAENILPQVESEANRILALMPTAKGETLRLELHTQRALKTADHLRETLDVIVEDSFGPRPYESFSGGEKGRLNVALRLALAFLLTSRRGAESKVLVLDEVPYLDALGEEQLVAVIASVANVYDRVLTVAHSAGVADAFETVIEVASDSNGASRIVTADREAVAV